MPAETKSPEAGRVIIAGREIEYRLRRRRGDGGLRVRVGIDGVQVLHSASRPREDIDDFLRANGRWLVGELDRLARLGSVRQVSQIPAGEMLFHGLPTPIKVETVPRRARSNRVRSDGHGLVIIRGRKAKATPAKTLENWLRLQARGEIASRIRVFAKRLGVSPGRLYIMDQQTKWGNCSSLHNLSFNWRIVMAPDSVLNYLVAHEVVHLAVPDHSHKFWLTVQSLCPQSERARQWLSANGHQLLIGLPAVLADRTRRETTGVVARDQS
jgi:predicted metal-dependent hydrolase